jgi:hypothetical protein
MADNDEQNWLEKVEETYLYRRAVFSALGSRGRFERWLGGETVSFW